ncbi:MAG TPA: response regulator [Candidatus Marinimicrobia bacterium]|nr:response regulator [Candidatus Neomarinimicrobiota bacterium]
MTTILLIDDDPDIQFVVRLLLESRAYKLRIEDSIKNANRALRDFIPDLILLDIMLPDGSGLDFLKVLSHIEPPINVGILSAKLGVELPAYPAKLELIRKPFSPDHFLFAVNRLIN